MVSKNNLLGDAFLEEATALGYAELLLIRLLIAVGALGGFLFELLAPFPVPHVQDGGPLFDRHPSLHAPFVRTLLSSLGLPIGHALAHEFGQIPAGNILLFRLSGALLAVLLPQCPLAHRCGRARLGHPAIAR
jgi:hypothetical protein